MSTYGGLTPVKLSVLIVSSIHEKTLIGAFSVNVKLRVIFSNLRFKLYWQDEVVLELLVRYMYSGQVSVTEEQLVPLVQAAKTLGIKGLVDVPVEDRVREAQQQEEQPAPVQSPPPPRRGCLKVKSASSLLSPVLRPVSRIGEVEVFPAPDTGTNGDMDTADIKEEETGDTSTADTEQSVSIFINNKHVSCVIVCMMCNVRWEWNCYTL